MRHFTRIGRQDRRLTGLLVCAAASWLLAVPAAYGQQEAPASRPAIDPSNAWSDYQQAMELVAEPQGREIKLLQLAADMNWSVDVDGLRPLLEKNQRAMELLRQGAAKKCSKPDDPPILTGRQLNRFYTLVRLVSLEARIAFTEGDRMLAAGRTSEVYAAAGHLASMGGIKARLAAISLSDFSLQLVYILLNQHETTAGALGRIHAAMKNADKTWPSLAHTLRNEREGTLRFLSDIESRTFDPAILGIENLNPGVNFARARAAVTGFFDLAIEAAAKPYLETAQAKYFTEEGLSAWRRENGLAGALVPALPKLLAADAIARTRMRATLILSALAMANSNSGQLPPELAKLVPEYLENLPLDPFSGAAFRFRTLADQAMIYSVGPDMTDDKAAQEWTASTPSGDVIFRLKTVTTAGPPAEREELSP